jgi:hypothetical protein
MQEFPRADQRSGRGSSRALWALAIVAAAAAMSGCAGSDESDTAGRATRPSTPPSETTPKPSDAGPAEGRSRRSDPRADIVPPGPPPERIPTQVPKTGDTSIQTYGKPASNAQFLAVANALRAYHLAVAARDAETACALLDSGTKRQLAQLLRLGAERGEAASPDEPSSCASALGRLLKTQTPAGASQARRLRVTDARVKGNDGFAIFRMPGVRQGGYPVRRENGSWKVAGLGGVPLQ